MPRSPGAARARALVFAPAAAALLAATWGGLRRMGWPWPALVPGWAMGHGPLMALGFLGTLISLERAVALGRPWAYAAPILSALAALSLLAGLPALAGQALLLAGASGLVAAAWVIHRLQPTLHHAVMVVGAALWAGGGLAWLAGLPLARVVWWFAGFLVLTIVGERLELSRLVAVSPAGRRVLVAALGAFLAGLILALARPGPGVRLAGAGLAAVALWLLRSDVARFTVRQGGLPRFIGVAVLAGYAWLLVAGGLWLAFGPASAGHRYDAMLHAVFLGFVMSMVMAHAPVIVPAVLGVTVPFRRAFYGPLGALHASVAVRLAGDLWPNAGLWRWGGLLNALALLWFLAQTARTAALGPRAAARPPKAPAATSHRPKAHR